jgi:hypothetical protein
MLKEQRVEEFAIDLVETPDPSNPAILVTVSAKGFDLGEIPKKGTTLKLSAVERMFSTETYDQYVFAKVMSGPPGWFRFLFNPPVLSADDSKLVPFREYNTTYDRSVTWPMVLTDLGFFEDTEWVQLNVDKDGVQTDNPTYFPRWAYVPEVQVDEQPVRVEEYLTSTSFDAGLMVGTKPVPTPVHADIRGKTVQFPPCLHPTIEIPRFDQEAEFFDCIVEKSEVVAGGPQVFPATSQQRWGSYSLWRSVKQNTDLFFTQKFTFIPPRVPKTIVI